MAEKLDYSKGERRMGTRPSCLSFSEKRLGRTSSIAKSDF